MATAKRINEPLALSPLAGLGAVILTGILWGTIGVVTAWIAREAAPLTTATVALIV